LLSVAAGILARIYFFDRAGDYVARVGVIQINFVASEYDYAKKWAVLWSGSINSTVAVLSWSTW
jgi:hypothetical protein